MTSVEVVQLADAGEVLSATAADAVMEKGSGGSPLLAADTSGRSVSLSSCSDESSSSSTGSPVGPDGPTAPGDTSGGPPVCRYFLRGMCRFGSLCRFSHNVVVASPPDTEAAEDADDEEAEADAKPLAPTVGRKQFRVDAPIFIPSSMIAAATAAAAASEEAGGGGEDDDGEAQDSAADPLSEVAWQMSYAQVARSLGGTVTTTGVVVDNYTVCPYVGPCPLDQQCGYDLHLEVCDMCDKFCLNPFDAEQRRRHTQECLRQHEADMELSFAVARSKDKKCGICFDTIVEKPGREKRFGILPNCNHIYCLECIRKWRQAPQFEHKITRSCPECRVCSDFVCPSAFWVDTKEEKDKLLSNYRTALNTKDCKYFKKGEGKCPFGNKCFYKHALPSGKLVDVGCPKRRNRRVRRSSEEVIDFLDMYLWDFVEARDFPHRYLWLDSNNEDTTDDEDDLLDFF